MSRNRGRIRYNPREVVEMAGEWEDAASVLKSLAAALNSYDWKQTRTACDALIVRLNVASSPFPEETAKKILEQLRRKRQFAPMQAVADALIRSGRDGARIRRYYAQAMIDQGNLTAPGLVLKSILDDASSSAVEKAEASGLLGRIYKQLYVNAGDPSSPRQQRNLKDAIQRYYDVYRTAPKEFLWHGINSVALLARAERDEVAVAGFPQALDVAGQIQGLLAQIADLDFWDRATAVENAVALGDHKAAYDHALYYVADPQVDAFECGSLLRQLEEVWQLKTDKEPGNTLIPTLRTRLLQTEGGRIEVLREDVVGDAVYAGVARKNLELVFGADRYQPLEWYRAGLKRCEAVARIESLIGRRVGTGCLVRASDFFPDRGEDEVLLLTNAHVISPAGSPFPGALQPEVARAVFEARNQTHLVDKLVWCSPPGELDAAFVTLKSMPEASELCPITPVPLSFDGAKQQRVYVIGYPLGGGLSFSLQDSIWLDTDGTFLHYRTPTEPGSSGSPVFDEQYWTLRALHHAGAREMPRLNGEGTVEANEGIAISAIQKATRGKAVGVNSAP